MRVHSSAMTARFLLTIAGLTLFAACSDDGPATEPQPPQLDGRQIFRFDTFGDQTFWTDTLRMHEVMMAA